MIISSRKYPFGTRITAIHTPSFRCVVSTAKEGLFQPLSTIIIEGDLVNDRANTRACGKIIYSSALRKGDIQQFHKTISEMIDKGGEDGLPLGNVLDSIFIHLKETGVASETINIA